MLSLVIVGGDPDLVRYVRQVCAEFADLCLYRVLDQSTRRYEIALVLNTYVPDVIFLDVTDLDSPNSLASACIEELLPQRSRIAVVPYSRNPRVFTDGSNPLNLGPVLTPPFNAEQLERAVREALRQRRTNANPARVIGFLPAKPGSGATTLAVNVAGSAAAIFRKKVLVIEADLQSGAITYLLDLPTPRSVNETIENPRLLASSEWDKLVSRSCGIDILPACGAPQTARGSRWDIYRLLGFARDRYDAVIVDLASQIDEISESVAAEAATLVLVSTPEVSSLSMVRRRLWELEARGQHNRNLKLVVNRHARGDPDRGQMEAVAHHKVAAALPEEPFAVKSAVRRSGLVNPECGFGRSLASLAASLLELEPAEPSPSPFALFKKFMHAAMGRPAQGGGRTSRLEATSACYHPGGRRQLDRW